jgi:hypothetical protein
MRGALLAGLVVGAAALGGCGDGTHSVQKRTDPVPAARSSVGAGVVIARGKGAGGLTAWRGYLVWNVWSSTTRRWRLALWHAGRVTSLPVPSRAVAFDADVGPDAAGRPVVVFSRCRQDPGPRQVSEWLRARGCRIEQLRLDVADAPHDVRGTGSPGESDTMPSRWGRWLAFARHRDGGSRSQILLLRDGGTPTPAPGHAPVDCESGCGSPHIHMTVTALDLGPRVAVAQWRQTGIVLYGVGDEEPLQLIPRDGHKPEVIDRGYIDGACGFRDPLSPTAVGGGAFWVGAGSPCDITESVLAWLDPRRHIRRVANLGPGLIFSAARAGSVVYWLRATGSAARREIPATTSCSYRHMDCSIVRTTRLTWRTVRPHQPLGPYSEGG